MTHKNRDDPDMMGPEEMGHLWAVRVKDPAFADWDDFTAWLESDPRHLEAYNVALDDTNWVEAVYANGQAAERQASMTAAIASPLPSRDRHRLSSMSGRRWGGAAVAAGLALTVGTGWYLSDRDTAQYFETGMGERRELALADGSHVVLNGGSRLAIDPARPRDIRLVRGEALFEVHHDAKRPFVVTVGDTRLIDAGTVFNVVKAGDGLDVAVAKGAVIYDADARSIRLDAGDALSRDGAHGAPVTRRITPESIGVWREGYLSYADASLPQIGADLSRNMGQAVTVDPRLAAQRFSGTLMIGGSPEAVMARNAPLLGIAVVRQDGGWVMTPIDAPTR